MISTPFPASSTVPPPSATLAPPALSVVIPVHDESGAILPLLAEIHAALAGRVDYEIVVVDDASRDGTAAELANAVRFLPRLRVLTHRRQCGQSAALASGIRAARAAWVATLDGDGQNDPRDVLALWHQLGAATPTERPAMLCGIRRERHDRWSKRFASRVANRVRRRALGDEIADTGCGLKLIRRDLFLGLPAFDHMHRFLPALALARGARVETAPVSHRPRRAGRSKYGILDRLAAGVVDLAGVWWLNRRRLAAELVPAAEPEVAP